MGKLFAFIRKNLHVIVFAVLFVTCIVMIYQSTTYQRIAIGNATRTLVGPFNRMGHNIVRHFNYSAENEALVAQNLRLMRDQESNFLVSSDSVSTAESVVTDTLTHRTTRTRLYDYSSANVVYNTIHRKHNYLMIDKGTADGVVRDMAVLSANGIVGVVTDVSPHFATVTSLLHPNSNISAKVMPANQLGTVAWKFGDPTSAYLNDIPEHMSIQVGDSVYTSGFSDIFPNNLLIGVITEKSKNPNSSFLTLKLRLATDFNHVNSVYLVRNLYKDEMDQLKANMEDE
ncbi:MAG: rod shape-determining protein MreC [Bacteroidales bacterium]|nr:rod shape-determining protein MreC [Bacteroidales bacterium]MCR5115318.1 rod shape-determining protein MreC [Bacteroidales bacterium]